MKTETMKQAEYRVVKAQFFSLYASIRPQNLERLKSMAQDMERADHSREDVIKTLVGCLYDGLAYGNW